MADMPCPILRNKNGLNSELVDATALFTFTSLFAIWVLRVQQLPARTTLDCVFFDTDVQVSRVLAVSLRRSSSLPGISRRRGGGATILSASDGGACQNCFCTPLPLCLIGYSSGTECVCRYRLTGRRLVIESVTCKAHVVELPTRHYVQILILMLCRYPCIISCFRKVINR